jgi:hypothetical protein
MRKLYEFLGEEYFEHDFTSITNTHKENDSQVYGFTDMHDVRSTLGKTSSDPREVLSPQILARCEGSEFWRNLQDYTPETAQTSINSTDDTPSTNTDGDNNTNIIGG